MGLLAAMEVQSPMVSDGRSSGARPDGSRERGRGRSVLSPADRGDCHGAVAGAPARGRRAPRSWWHSQPLRSSSMPRCCACRFPRGWPTPWRCRRFSSAAVWRGCGGPRSSRDGRGFSLASGGVRAHVAVTVVNVAARGTVCRSGSAICAGDGRSAHTGASAHGARSTTSSSPPRRSVISSTSRPVSAFGLPPTFAIACRKPTRARPLVRARDLLLRRSIDGATTPGVCAHVGGCGARAASDAGAPQALRRRRSRSPGDQHSTAMHAPRIPGSWTTCNASINWTRR